MKNHVPILSMFQTSVSQGKTPSGTIDMLNFLDGIRKGDWKDSVARVRAEETHKERQKIKRETLPYVTISGIFTARKDADLTTYSKYMAIDIDHLESNMDRVRNAVVNDEYTFAAFTSVGGVGLCVIIKTSSPANHMDHFRWAQEHYKKISDVDIDTACSNISRARFVSHDPQIFSYPDSKVAGKKAEPKKQKASPKFLPSTQPQVDRIVAEICGNGHNIVDSYSDWKNLAFGLAFEMGEGGRQHFHNISMISDKYSDKEVDKLYSSAVAKADGSRTIGTLFGMAKEVGIEVHNAEEKKAFAISKTAKIGKSDIEAAVLIAENTGVDPVITRAIAEKVFASDDYNDITEGDNIINLIAAFIKINASLECNKITGKVENNGVPITDKFFDSIYIKSKSMIQSKDKVTMQDVRSIIGSDIIPEYCPIQRWFDKNNHLPQHPEIIDQLLDTIPYEKQCAREFIRPWLLGIPASYYGDVVRLVLVLCGKQETGKTWWLRNLFPPELKPYWSNNSLMNESEVPLIMSTKLVNLDDEFGGKSRKDALKFKELTSTDAFDHRKKYGRVMETLRRITMLCGTSNEVEILNDETGNTRILPVEFNTPYDWDAYNKIDKTQLMIEVFRAQKRGETWQLNDAAREALEELNEIHKIADFELELIDIYYEEDPSPHKGKVQTTTEIIVYLEKVSGQRISHPRKLGVALKKRFPFVSQRINGKPRKGYRLLAREATTNSPF